MNRLKGRMLYVPAPKGKKREILFIYGHHSSLERWWGLVEDLSRYGTVTMPDLPGFGGMESFYKIGQKPTIDNLADYLAAFVKLRYKRKRVSIVGLSFGFVIATRMLQRYPELAKKVDLLVSVVGFSHRDDFLFSRRARRLYRGLAAFYSRSIPAFFFRHVLVSAPALKLAYTRTYSGRDKFKAIGKDEYKRTMDFEIQLWHSNDIRTHMASVAEFLDLNNCNKQVDLPVWHVSVKADRYFDNHVVEQHMRIIFKNFHQARSRMKTHAPSIIADAEMAAPFIPLKIRKLLSE